MYKARLEKWKDKERERERERRDGTLAKVADQDDEDAAG